VASSISNLEALEIVLLTLEIPFYASVFMRHFLVLKRAQSSDCTCSFGLKRAKHYEIVKHGEPPIFAVHSLAAKCLFRLTVKWNLLRDS
jgi:hypothetical protein